MVDFNYDERGDALSIHKKGVKVKYSVEVMDNYLVDVDFDGRLVGLEILNASSALDLSKVMLKSIRKASLSSCEVKGGARKLVFLLQLDETELRSQVLVPLAA